MDASKQIDEYIASLQDWRGPVIAKLRKLIVATEDLTEEWKWSSPVWSHNGPVVSVSAFKNHVGINFFQGASLSDPDKLFNAGLEAKKTRAINLQENDTIDEAAFQKLVQAAVRHNGDER